MPDLMLLDLHMPGMDGLTLLEKLKSDPVTSALPIIMISSDTASGHIERARELGAVAYIEKPFRLDGLRSAMKAATPKRP